MIGVEDGVRQEFIARAKVSGYFTTKSLGEKLTRVLAFAPFAKTFTMARISAGVEVSSTARLIPSDSAIAEVDARLFGHLANVFQRSRGRLQF